ncbi:MAG: archaellin/type IV pilin N-terminal domain-containing protein [Candidatus Woesearchaeota archaeon]
MAFHNKKGIMGIGTLIIFIATILVAAVAAAVLISTSNVLQQRSLLVGQESRKSITDAVDVVSILAASDSSKEEFNNYEILVRLSPGSDPLQMRKFNMQYIAPNFDKAADLLYDDNETVVELGSAIDTTTNVTTYDMDGDGQDDWVTLVQNVSGDNEGLSFYLTDLERWSDNISLGRDLSDASTSDVTLKTGQVPITVGEDYYGYVTVKGSTGTDDTIDAGVNVTVEELPEECNFELLPPEEYYCYQVMNGNDDYVLGSGERFKLYFKTKEENAVSIGEDIMFIFTTEKGRISEARARTPDVITSTKTKLWPLG